MRVRGTVCSGTRGQLVCAVSLLSHVDQVIRLLGVAAMVPALSHFLRFLTFNDSSLIFKPSSMNCQIAFSSNRFPAKFSLILPRFATSSEAFCGSSVFVISSLLSCTRSSMSMS